MVVNPELGWRLARLVGLIFVFLGVWVLMTNLRERDYSGPVLAWIVGAGFVGAAGGVVYQLSIEGPAGFRARWVRGLGWAGMLVLALLPTSLTFPLIVILLLVLPTVIMRRDPPNGERGPTVAESPE